jgi:hypothetical protein
MNKEQQELLDGVYVYYCKSFENQTLIEEYSFDTDSMTQFMFINKCKNDKGFSEKWGLTIEERALSLEERAQWLQDNTEWDLLVGNLDHDHIREVVEEEAPTKLITITYNNKTITSYE